MDRASRKTDMKTDIWKQEQKYPEEAGSAADAEAVSEYLSDAELERLVALVEQHELVSAPPDLKTGILSECGVFRTDMREKEAEKSADCRRKADFRQYCFRVWTSVAAAIFLVFMLPFVMDRIEAEADQDIAGTAVFYQETQVGGPDDGTSAQHSRWRDGVFVPIQEYLFTIFQ